MVESEAPLEKWSQNVNWEKLCGKIITETDANHGKITLNNGNSHKSYYICQYGGLIYLQESPEKPFPVESLDFLKNVRIERVGIVYPPQKEGLDTMETKQYETPYEKAYMASIATLYNGVGTKYTTAYILRADIGQTPTKIKVAVRQI